MTDGHLTDEQLSSHLDGVSARDPDEKVAPSIADHLATCAPCRRRLAALGAVRERMRTPVEPVAPEVRAASIASVLRAAELDPSGAGARSEAGVAEPDEVHAAPIVMARRRPQVLVGAAAAVLVLAGAIGIPIALSGRSTSGGSEASGPARATASAPAGVNGTSGLSQHVTSAVSDLGPLESVGALRSRVDGLFPAASSAAPTGQPGTASVPAASPPAPPAAVAPTPSGSGSQDLNNTFGASPAMTTQFERCLSSATRAAGSASPASPASPAKTLQLLATATFKGAPALVYVFQPGTGPDVQSAVVVARDGCKVLATTSL
jgi:hypothetical protein